MFNACNVIGNFQNVGTMEKKSFKFGKQWSEAWELGLEKRRVMGR